MLANRHPDSLRRALQPRRRASAPTTPPSTAASPQRRHADKRALFAAIRELAQREELSIRALAEHFGVHRRTIRQGLSAPEPPARKKRAYPAPRLDPAREMIDAMLLIEPTLPAGHIWERLLDDHNILTSYSTVRKYVAERRSPDEQTASPHAPTQPGPKTDKIR